MPRGPNRTPEELLQVKQTVLHTAAVLFLETGYTETSFSRITEKSGLGKTTVFRAYGSKDNILAALVEYVLDRQFRAAGELVAGKTDDPILYYAAETTLQLHMAESHAHIRELYEAAYSQPATSQFIQQTIAGKLGEILAADCPGMTAARAFELELASGGIMRSFMLAPCTADFPMARKVACFLESSFRVFGLSPDKAAEALAFVGQFDYPALAQRVIDQMLDDLKHDRAAI